MYCLKLLFILGMLCFVGCCSKEEFSFGRSIVNKFEENADTVSRKMYHNGKIGGEERIYKDMLLTDLYYDSENGSSSIVKFFYLNNGDFNNPSYEIKQIESFIDSSGTGSMEKYGHFFDFDKREYAWRSFGTGLPSLIISFDKLGNIINKSGSVKVDIMVNKTSNIVTVLYTTAFHKLDSVIISSANSPTSKISDFIRYKPLPLVNLLEINFKLDSVFYLKSIVTERQTLKRDVFYDTIIIK